MSDALQKSLLEAVIQQMPAAIVIAEAASGRIVFGEDAAAHVPRYREFLERSLRQGEVIENEEVEVTRADKRRAVIRVRSAPIRDDADHIVAAVATFYDVTEEQRRREALEMLAEASAAAQSLEYDDTVLRIANLALPGFADLVFVHLIDPGGAVTRQEVAAADPERARALRRISE